MRVEVHALNPSLLVASRGVEIREIREAMNEIEADEDAYGRLLTLATYDLPEDKDRATAHRTSLVTAYGNTPAVLGWRFSIARSTNGKEEYLAGQYLPELIEEGALEAFQESKRVKAAEAREAKAAREANGVA